MEKLNITEVIDEDGVAMVVLPMNLEYTYTNEFGEQETTNDKNKGIPTTSISRFRFNLTYENEQIATAKFLVPNVREFNQRNSGVNLDEYDPYLLTTYQFSDVFEDYLKMPSGYTFSDNQMISSAVKHKKDLILNVRNNEEIPEDYFYKFIYGKVYTVSSFQGTHYEAPWYDNLPIVNLFARKDAFLGIKEIRPNSEEDCSSSTNYFPVNYAYKNSTKIGVIISDILLYISFIFAVVVNVFWELLGSFFKVVGEALYGLVFTWPFNNWRPLGPIGQSFLDFAYKIQAAGTQTLSLTTYPDCEECTTDTSAGSSNTNVNIYDSIGEIKYKVFGLGNNSSSSVYLLPIAISTTGTTFLPNVFGETATGADPYTGTTLLHPYSGQTLTSGDKSIYRTQLYNLRGKTTISGDSNDSRFVGNLYPYYNDTELSSFSPWVSPTYPIPFNGTGYTSYSYPSFFYNLGNTESENVTPAFNFKRIIADGSTFTGVMGGYSSQIITWLNTFGTLTNTTASNNVLIEISRTEWNKLTGVNYGEYKTDETTAHFNNGNIVDRGTYAVMKIYDRKKIKTNVNGTGILSVQEGCDKYDKLYKESSTYGYIVGPDPEYGGTYDNVVPPMRKISAGDPLLSGETILSTMGGVWDSTEPLPRSQAWSLIGNSTYDRKTKSGLTEIRNGVFTVIPVIGGQSKNFDIIEEWYKRKRVGLFFCGGVVNYSFIDNWLNGVLYFFKFKKRIMWDDASTLDLSQSVSEYPRELVFYNVMDQNFYYRSTPYNPFSKKFVGQSGSVNPFRTLPTIELLHPTTFYDVGVRDEFFREICFDSRVDPDCSVIRDIGITSYKDPAKIIEYAINYRLDINDGNFSVDDFFSSTGEYGKIIGLDGDIVQLLSINSEAGIKPFDLDTTQYFLYNDSLMDPEDPYFASYFKSGADYSPVPIDFKFEENGFLVRMCLNNRLGDYTQKVPFYLWDKSGPGFGPYGNDSDKQRWDRTHIASMPLQRMFSISGVTTGVPLTNYLMTGTTLHPSNEEYLLKPMTKSHPTYSIPGSSTSMLSRFEVIRDYAPTTGVTATGFYENNLWLHVTGGTVKFPESGDIYTVVNQQWVKQDVVYIKNYHENFIFQTANNYAGNKQVLSTPFMFYFGLRPHKTALDELTKYYGPKGAFPTVY